jgi:predicted TIM-barrel enzyme|tara:strand:+ start:646 stop:801 length:156 start_codon:yes stop_codon:yes gene_type:complete
MEGLSLPARVLRSETVSMTGATARVATGAAGTALGAKAREAGASDSIFIEE